MRVAQETFTVITDATLREIAVLLAGMRITLTPEEARGLAGELSKGVHHLGNAGKSHSDVTGAVEGDGRDFSAELRAVKEEMKRNPSFPRTA
jgi:hypothetical protein